MARSGKAVGEAGEEAAVGCLIGLGYRIVARNVRFRIGELDVVARDGADLVFVEVKTRSGTGFGTPAEAVTAQKRQRLVRLAELYLASTGGHLDRPCRFDVVAVASDGLGGWRCEVIRNAFSA